MAKKYRDIVNPITAREWFLHYLFTDEGFIEIKNQFQAAINDIDFVGPDAEDAERLERERAIGYYSGLLSERFNITKEVARRGLRYKKYSREINKDRVPVAKIEDDRVVISIGSETRLEDIDHLWEIQVTHLQTKLPRYSSQRTVPAKEPLLAYIVHKRLLAGEKMPAIHRDYQDGTLDDCINPNLNSSLEDFRKYYKRAVQGFLDQT